MAEGDFEAPLRELQKQIDELNAYPGDPDKEREARHLSQELDQARRDVFSRLTPWQKTQVARNPNRPYTLDYIQAIFTDFIELHGDRKAMRVMALAAKFRRPIITFVDTPGAYPGLDAEERGQAEAIAYNLREMSRLATPIIVNVTGEGGSGGALAVAVGDRVNMLEHSIYSVISPEGCASILWRDARQAEIAATAMKITAPDLKGFGLVDEIIPEPPGGAHSDHEQMFQNMDRVLTQQLQTLQRLSLDALVEARYQRFRQ
ncbi:MAG: acetyl-CoA carboxylase carboxyl transferase subunit alpha, partial [Vicinamibacteria bacterium]|nr:acetyl-CoA carboxylase carboxyl transferase subunit alpha [Vicinamibacteria bacterium]